MYRVRLVQHKDIDKIFRLIKSGTVTMTTMPKTKIDLKKRIKLHNNNKGAKFTRGRRWKLIYKEKLDSKKEAISREYYIKKNRTFRNKIKENLK